MTTLLYRTDAYLRDCDCTVQDVTEDGRILVDRTVFYATGGGQPGDSGTLEWEGGSARIADTRKTGSGLSALVAEEGSDLPSPGTSARQRLDWDRRYCHMRIHTALHLLSVAVPLPVTSGSITAEKGRLDFDMPEAVPDRDKLEGDLNALIERDLTVAESWISDEELAANPGLVKTMAVKPPTGTGKVRLVRIGTGTEQVDLQPCGGTHVARTGEIGQMRLGKIEKKGRQNRRINILFA